jgi:hypothetical protein
MSYKTQLCAHPRPEHTTQGGTLRAGTGTALSSPHPPPRAHKKGVSSRCSSIRIESHPALIVCSARASELAVRVQTHQASMLAMGFTPPQGPSGVLRAIDRCLCESGSKTVQAISGYGAQRGRVVPAESIMGSGGPHGRCAPIGSTWEHCTPTPMYRSAGERHPARSAQPGTSPSMRGLRRLQ